MCVCVISVVRACVAVGVYTTDAANAKRFATIVVVETHQKVISPSKALYV